MYKTHSNNHHSDETVADILNRLSSLDAGPAWVEFLDRYAQLIMNTANQFEYRSDRVDECFTFVCEQLNDNGFRRLLNFNTHGAAKFQTWLGTVVFNLCVDWHRIEFGRVTMLPAISALPAFDQSVYHMVIEQGMTKEACFQTLIADFPDLTREMVVEALNRIYSFLTPRQRWQINVRNLGRSRSGRGFGQGQIERLADPGSGPEVEAQKHQDLENLRTALSHLPPQQRLLIKLRFQEGLSLRKISQLRCLGDTNRTWRHIQAAVKALFDHIHKKKTIKNRKN